MGDVSPTERMEALEEEEESLVANEYADTVRSWGFDPKSRKGVAAMSLLKSTDQATPMMMRKYRKRGGCGLSLLILTCMVVAFGVGFVWVARQVFGSECNEDNGCETCSLTISDTSGGDASLSGVFF